MLPFSTFDSFIAHVNTCFQKPLPGEVAHASMAASSRLTMANQPNEKTRESAVLLVFYPVKDKIVVPLILRPSYDGVHGGQVSYPGGRMERKDKNLINTALREAQEEVGVRLMDIKVLGTLTKLYIPPSNFNVLPVVGYLDKQPDFYPDAREVETIIEVSLDTLLDPVTIQNTLLKVRGVDIQAPYFAIEDYKVWGATAMIMAEFLSLIRA